MADDNIEDKSPVPESVLFHYIKGNYFRVIHTDGVVGGLQPTLGIQMTIFSQRVAIPQQIEHAINPDGTLGDELSDRRVGKSGIVRELEADLIMNLETAEKIHAWLGRRIADAKSILTSHEPQKGE